MEAAVQRAGGTVVMKFHGSTVAEPDEVRQIAHRLVAARERGLRVVGTISALGRTTASLLELAHEVAESPHPRELDMLLSTGERTACALVAMAVHDLGHEAVSLTGSQAGILTDAVYTKAKIREITPVRVVQALDEGQVVLVAGFQGFSRDTMDVTTLGRGGTDTTAVALAAALGASCEIYSEAAGVFTADPRIVPDARKLAAVSYEEMLEMSSSGAKAIMLRAVELARNHGVRIHARSTSSEEVGTVVQAEGLEEPIVSAVTHSQDEVVFVLRDVPDRPGSAAAQKTIGPIEIEEIADLAKVSLVGAGMRSHPGVAARMFRTLADEGINLQLISTSPIKISCMVARDVVETAVRALHAEFGLGERSER
jgi:aspartate kinase